MLKYRFALFSVFLAGSELHGRARDSPGHLFPPEGSSSQTLQERNSDFFLIIKIPF